MCRLMNLSRSGYYEWLERPKSARRIKDEELSMAIGQVFSEGRGLYGTRRIKKRLEAQEVYVSRRRIGRLMKEKDLLCKAKRKFKATTDSKHDRPVAPNLLARKFDVSTPRFILGWRYNLRPYGGGLAIFSNCCRPVFKEGSGVVYG